MWYTQDLKELQKEATDQADRALDVDFSTLRGQGPEFVLEFTAVVVVIFAAVILGVLNVLKNEQIGTLLAAIAGYVLGRATTRRSSGGTDEATAKPGKGTQGRLRSPEQSDSHSIAT